MATSATFTLDAGTTAGSMINAAHFGANLLHHHDEVGEGASFPDVADRVGIDYIRYPGGTVAEHFFDLATPEATSLTSIINGITRDNILPLSDFLDYAADHGKAAIIVIPTYRYFDTATGKIDPDAEDIIKGFIADVMNGEYGNADIQGFELGNEWYQEPLMWTASEFGAVQAQIAVWIDEVRDDPANQSWPDFNIYAQSGRTDDDSNGENDNAEIVAQFNDLNAMEAIDGVAHHLYASTDSQGGIYTLGNGALDRLESLSQYWNPPSSNALDLIVTEWNVGDDGDGFDDQGNLSTVITGLERSNGLLNLFSGMVQEGVDLATFWTAQTGGLSGLSDPEILHPDEDFDGSDHLTTTGYLIQMMERALMDTQAITRAYNIRDANEKVAEAYVFQGGGRTVIYVASGVDQEIDLNLDISAYVPNGAHVHATILGVVDGQNANDFRPDAQLEAISNSTFDPSAIHLDPYEVIQIVISDGIGVHLYGDEEIAVNDTLEGGLYADTLLGNLGDDSLFGAAGFDTLYGGAGNDRLNGGAQADNLFGDAGNDTLNGEAGNDHLFGGDGRDALNGHDGNDVLFRDAGNDRLRGDGGNDRLYGGQNNDVLTGEAGNDSLYGNADNDRLFGNDGFDLLNGGEGQDTLMGGAQADNLYGGIGNDSLDGEEGNDRLLGGAGDDFGFGNAGNDTLFGDHGNDTLNGWSGNDRFFGGAGNDVILGGSDNDTIYGGSGFDTIIGGYGNDLMQGDFNADTFVFRNNDGNDTIADFAATNIYEKIDLSAVSAITNLADLQANHLTQVGANVVINTGGNHSITLLNVNLADLDGTDFIF